MCTMRCRMTHLEYECHHQNTLDKVKLTEQARIEGADCLSFGEYLAQYFAG